MSECKQIVFLKKYSTYDVDQSMMPTDPRWMGKLIKRGIARIADAPKKAEKSDAQKQAEDEAKKAAAAAKKKATAEKRAATIAKKKAAAAAKKAAPK